MENIDEGMIKNQEDIYYNKDKLDSGEINICFITGHSGSGKSTMGKDMSSKKNVEHYELDDLVHNCYFSDDNLKEYGDLIYSFLMGSGKKYRLSEDEYKKITESPKDFEKYGREITQSFVDYSIKYAKSHKDTVFVIDGIWLYLHIKPSTLDDCAVYIKGTSALISTMRALKRDWNYSNKKINLKIKRALFRLIKITDLGDFEKKINVYRSYFGSKETNESSVEEKVKYYKNPDGALKNRITRRKNSNRRVSRRTNVHISPLNTKKEDVDDIEEVAEYAKNLLIKEIDGSMKYESIMMEYVSIANSYAILSTLGENSISIFNYCSKIFNDTHPGYTMNMDDNCIYITKKINM